MPRKTFVAGEILTASDVNTNLMDQSVMVFDDATDRATAIPTPVEGMVTYLKDTNLVQAFTGSAFTAVGGILQVVSTTKTDTFTQSVAAFTASDDVPGLSASVSPSSTSNKVLVTVTGHAHVTAIARGLGFILRRGSSDIAVGDASTAVTGAISSGFEDNTNNFTIQFLDSPNTTATVVYGIKLFNRSGTARTLFLNRTSTDLLRSVSTITVQEVAV